MENTFGRGSMVRVLAVLCAVGGVSLLIAACGSSSSSTTSSKSSSSSSASGKHLKIAYLSFAVDNSYDAPMLAAAQGVAGSENASVTVFDANNEPNTQYSQFQDALAAGGYDGIITQPIESTNLIPLVAQAVAKGIKVVNIDQILGPKLNTSAVQVKGLSGNVTFDPTLMGQDLGNLVAQACTTHNLKPCNVGYLYDIKASALDVAIRAGFNAAIASHPSIKVVAEGQDFFTPAEGLTAVQGMLSGNSSINLIAGSDQGIEGAVEAIGSKKIQLVGYGGSAAGIAGVAAGKWYGTIAQDPASEGRVGMQQLIEAIRTGKSFAGTNPLTSLPDGGVITKSNAHLFTGEWPG
jgi:ribose transport system substrate-binding protein